MQFLNWGKQASVFGLPIGLALIFTAFYNIYSINELFSLVRLDRPYIQYHFLGTVISVAFDFPRIYFLVKMSTAILWGVITIINVAIFRRTIWIAYIHLAFAALYYCVLSTGLCYGLYAFSQDAYIESKRAYHRQHMRSFFEWPKHFWVALAINLITDFLVGYLVLDMHWSYIKILQHNGSGWERKAYYEIHQPEGETVATLQAQWDARMGLEKKREPEMEKAIKRQHNARHNEQNDEHTPLITEVLDNV